MQIVVAEHDGRGVAQRHDPAQHTEGVGSSVDEVTDEPEPVVCREIELVQQRVELNRASLHVTDGVDGQRRPQCSMPGIASVNGAIGALNS